MDNRRHTIVVNKKFQYQYSLMVAALTVLLVNFFVFFRLLFPGDHPLSLTPMSTFALAAVELILIFGVWYGSLKASHKIAGPIFVFSREIAKLGSGDLTARIQLRPSDEFQDVAAELNGSIDELRSRVTKLKDISQQLQNTEAGDRDAILKQLHDELSRLKTDPAA